MSTGTLSPTVALVVKLVAKPDKNLMGAGAPARGE